MLDYAANAATVRWASSSNQTRSCSTFHDGSSVDDALRDAFGIDDPDAYWTMVRRNLSAERLRLIFVSDLDR